MTNVFMEPVSRILPVVHAAKTFIVIPMKSVNHADVATPWSGPATMMKNVSVRTMNAFVLR